MKKHINILLIFTGITVSILMIAFGVITNNWYGVVGWAFAALYGFIIYTILEVNKKEDTNWKSIENRFKKKYFDNDDYLGI